MIAASGSRAAEAQCRVGKLQAPAGIVDPWFGSSIRIQGDHLVIGTQGSEFPCPPEDCYLGSVFAFRKEGTSWQFEQQMFSWNGESDDYFPSSLAMSENVLVVGAKRSGHDDAGAAYVFRRTGSSWVEEQMLVASDREASGLFGWAVAVDSDVIVVGAAFDDNPCGQLTCYDSGSAYLFRYDGATWTEEQKLVASNLANGDHFGVRVAINGDVVLAGADSTECLAGFNCGSVYAFQYNGMTWTETQEIRSTDLAEGDYFGDNVALQQSRAVIGASYKDCDVGRTCGAAYVFEFDGSTWVERQKLLPSDPEDLGLFGAPVVLQGDTIATVARGTGSNCYENPCGTVYVFTFDGNAWIETRRIRTPDLGITPPAIYLGNVALWGTLLLTGLPVDFGALPESAAVFLVDLDPQTDSLLQEIPAISKGRFLSFEVPVASAVSPSGGLRVALASLHHPDPPYTGGAAADFSAFEGQYRWVGPPSRYIESTSNPTAFWSATLQCEPYFSDWSTLGVLHVTGAEIVPSSVYDVQLIPQGCDTLQEVNYSPVLSIETSRWGDIVDPFSPPSPATQPDVTDVSALVNKFKSAVGAPIKARALLAGNLPDPGPDIGFAHISACVDAFKGTPYPYSGPQPCP